MSGEAVALAAKLGNVLSPSLRTITDTTNDDTFRPYDRYGVVLPGMTWLPLSIDSKHGLDIFILRFDAGSQSFAHEHMAPEQFLMLKGTLTDCDGKVFKEGDFVRFEKGSKHHSMSTDGCELLVMLQARNRTLDND